LLLGSDSDLFRISDFGFRISDSATGILLERPMRVECECGKALKVNDKLLGKRVRCPACGSTLLVEAEPDAIAVGRPKPAATVADSTPPPRQRRPLDDEEPAPRRRARAEDFDDDDDRPRRKKKKQQSSGAPLLLILGGVAAVFLLLVLVGGGVGAYLLFFRKGSDTAGAPTTGPGSKSEPVAIKFRVAPKVGDMYEFNITADSTAKNMAGKGDSQTFKVTAQGTAKALAVDQAGRETRTELTIKKLTSDKGFGDVRPLAPNTVVLREVRAQGFATYSIKGGGALAADAQLALMEVFGKGLKEEDLDDDEVFGTTEKKAVGDSWPVKKGPLVRSINEGAKGIMQVREDSVTGTVKFSGVTQEGGTSYLNFDVAITINQMGTPVNAGPGMQQTVNVTLTMDVSYRLPADYSTGAVRQTQKLDMRLDTTMQGIKATVNIMANKVGTRKWLPSGGKQRASVVLPPAAGLPRQDVAFRDCPEWRACEDRVPRSFGQRLALDALGGLGQVSRLQDSASVLGHG
jgi:hypothetical protein